MTLAFLIFPLAVSTLSREGLSLIWLLWIKKECDRIPVEQTIAVLNEPRSVDPRLLKEVGDLNRWHLTPQEGFIGELMPYPQLE
jgi:hypothetical protein